MNIINNSYEKLKKYFDDTLNKDKSTFKSSNDEPTPIDCVEAMFSKLPDTFYHKQNLKILDPCCGNGNFHFVLRNLLLQNKCKNYELHFNDINTHRTDNVKEIFGSDAIVSNLDFLTIDPTNKFDLIVANPPYAKLMTDGKRASKNHNLIKPFIKKSLELLKDGGYIIYIIPDNWMSLSDRNTLISDVTQYQFHWLDIHSAKKWFPKIGSSFTWFVLEKTASYKPFTVETIYNKKHFLTTVNSQVRDYIPLLYTDTVQSILEKTIDMNNEKFKVETSSDLHKFTKKNCISTTSTEVFKYKLIHTPKQTVYANRPHKFQDGFKVFISTTDTYKVFVDNCGMTQSIAFIRCESEAEAIAVQQVLQHKMYIFLNNICRWGNFNNIRILQRFPKAVDASTVYQKFNLTNQEITFIEDLVK